MTTSHEPSNLSFSIAGLADPGFAMAGMLVMIAFTLAPGVVGFFTATRGRKHSSWLDG